MKYELEIDVSPVYELLDSFMLYVTKKWISNLEIGTDWVRDIDGRFPPMQLAALKQAAEWPLTTMMCSMPGLTAGEASKVLQFLNELEASTVEDCLVRTAPSSTTSHLRNVPGSRTAIPRCCGCGMSIISVMWNTRSCRS